MHTFKYFTWNLKIKHTLQLLNINIQINRKVFTKNIGGGGGRAIEIEKLVVKQTQKNIRIFSP